MKCEKCGANMYLRYKERGTRIWECTKCDYELRELREAFEPKAIVIDPSNYSLDALVSKVKVGEIGLNQIPLPERDKVRREIKK